MDVFIITYMQVFTLLDVNWWTGVMYIFCGLFVDLLAVYTLILMAPIDLWCYAFLQICSV